MKHSDLLDLRNEIDSLLKVNIPELEYKAYELFKHKGALHAVKMVKDKTGWGLKESKEFMDRLRALEVPFQRVP